MINNTYCTSGNSPTISEDQSLTKKQLAKLSQFSERTLKKLMDLGKLKYYVLNPEAKRLTYRIHWRDWLRFTKLQ